MPQSTAIKLTEKEIARLQKQASAEQRRIRFRDKETRGLIVDVSKKGVASFYIRVTSDKEVNWERLGEFGASKGQLTLVAARTEANARLGLVGRGYSPAEARRVLREEPTLRELFEHYMREHAERKRKTAAVMQKDFERNFCERSKLADRKASKITRGDVLELRNSLGEAYGHYTANRTMQLLRAIFNKAIKWELVGCKNPAEGIEMFQEQARERVLTSEEVKRLLIALQGFDPLPETRTADNPFMLVSEAIRQLVALAILTGVRKSNVCAMRFSQIDWDKKIWTIPASEMKNRQPQAILLTAYELDILREREREVASESDFIFPGTGASGHVQDFKRSWTTLRKMANIPDVHFHDLRGSLASWMASENVNAVIIKGALAHADLKTTMKHYAFAASDAQRGGRLTAHKAMFEAAGDTASDLLKTATEQLTGGKVTTLKRKNRPSSKTGYRKRRRKPG